MTRYRTNLVEERARTINRLQKTLEDTNLKLGDVVTDILGKSSRAILDALLAGQTDPALLADLARGRLKAKRAQLEQALVGTIKPHHRFILAEHLAHIDDLDEAIVRVEGEIDTFMYPETLTSPDEMLGDEVRQEDQKQALTWEQAIALLCSIPGISQRSAQGILAEIGLDMDRFPSAKHLASWAGMSPGNRESAGKRFSGKTNKGSPRLRKLLVEVAHAAAHTKKTYLAAHYQRLKARRGAKKAMIAVGHTILVIIYHLLDEKKVYEDLGGNYFDEHEREATEKRLVRRLERLGFEVSLQPMNQVS